ncbi:MAG: hypothetical protein AAFV53_26665 [Myxococcota bacterium]
MMRWFMWFALAAGCRTDAAEVKTAELRAIGDVDAMADAWCDVLACRSGFDDVFDSVDACADLYRRYWGDAAILNNKRACFEDIDETDRCIDALSETRCGGATPAACVDIIACQLPEADDTGTSE